MKKSEKKILSLILGLLFINLSLIFAATYPIPYPHAFNGVVNILDGKNPNGQMLKAEINGNTAGFCLVVNNTYDLIITSTASGTIKFYFGDGANKSYSDEEYSFEPLGVTDLDLNFDTILDYVSICGNGACDLGECGTCTIDCKVSQCLGNGICDSQMGETCSTASQDCGICQTNNNGNSGGASGGGGGGGGGGSSSSRTANTSTASNLNKINQNSEKNNAPLTIKNLNEISHQENTNPGITGAVVGFVKTPLGIISSIFIFLIILLAVIILIIKKRKK